VNIVTVVVVTGIVDIGTIVVTGAVVAAVVIGTFVSIFVIKGVDKVGIIVGLGNER